VKNLLGLLRGGHRPDTDALSALADGRLSADESARLEAHLAGCDACTRQLDELQRVRAMLSSLGQAPVPRSFRLHPSDVTTPAPATAEGFATRARTYAPQLAMAAVLLLGAVIAFDVGTRGSGESGSFTTAERNATESLAMGDEAAQPAADSANGAAESADGDDAAGGTDPASPAAAMTQSEDAPQPPADAATAATAEAARRAESSTGSPISEGDNFEADSSSPQASAPEPITPGWAAYDEEDAQALNVADDSDDGVRTGYLVAEVALAALAAGAVGWLIYTRFVKKEEGS
jgi:hypothetical protein